MAKKGLVAYDTKYDATAGICGKINQVLEKKDLAAGMLWSVAECVQVRDIALFYFIEKIHTHPDNGKMKTSVVDGAID